MTRILVFAATAIGVTGAVASADAQSRPRQQFAPSSRLPYPPVSGRPSGPPWAQPDECYIDESFGRFSPCR